MENHGQPAGGAGSLSEPRGQSIRHSTTLNRGLMLPGRPLLYRGQSRVHVAGGAAARKPGGRHRGHPLADSHRLLACRLCLLFSSPMATPARSPAASAGCAPSPKVWWRPISAGTCSGWRGRVGVSGAVPQLHGLPIARHGGAPEPGIGAAGGDSLQHGGRCSGGGPATSGLSSANASFARVLGLPLNPFPAGEPLVERHPDAGVAG